jgi:hypothetical protein
MAVFLVVAAGSALFDGCTGGGTCADLETCPVPDASTTDVATDGGFEAGDAIQEDASSTQDTHVCDPKSDPGDDPCVLDDALGVFVSASAPDGGSGGKADPLKTITLGIAKAANLNKSRVYVCGGSYKEQVVLDSAHDGVSIYGGLACLDGWSWTGAQTQVTAPTSLYALRLDSLAKSADIEDLTFVAPDAIGQDAAGAGNSSIAAFVHGATVNLRRVVLIAGKGADGASGADGTSRPNYTGPAPAGGAQVWTTISGLFSPISGGDGGTNQCTVFGSSAGGKGGLGCASAAGVQGGAGSAGTANPQPPVTAAGRDGLPKGMTMVGDAGAAMMVTANDPGADGVARDGGVAAQDYGILSPSGWMPAAGGDGAPGGPGQGGAGAADPLYGQCSVAQPSLGGGGGGAGGCGGAGGKGGGGGGASIALASVDSTMSLTDCILSTSAAGSGGAGGAGQDGQPGGAGGDVSGASQLHAVGGAGGNGAGGSGGAGGTGGISVGILYLGSMIQSDMATTESTRLGVPGAAGAAGPGGRHPPPTGVDGHSGARGSAGTSVGSLRLM